MNPHDSTLLHRWQTQADAEAFRELVRRYANLVYATAVRTLGDNAAAEDVAQDTFLKLAQGAQINRSLAAWLHRVATNQSRDLIKTNARRRTREHTWSKTRPTTTTPIWDDIREHLDAAIDDLPESLRAVVIGHFLENKTHDELAQSLGLTRSAVSKRSARGIDQLRESLRKRGVPITAPALTVLMTEHATAHTAPASLFTSLNEIGLVGKLALAKTTSGGLFSMQSLLGITAIAAIAGTTVWFASSTPDNAATQSVQSSPERTNAAQRVPDETPALAQRLDSTESASPTTLVAQATAAGQPTPSRVYDADSMEPLSGVPIHIARIPPGVPFFTAPPGDLAGFDMNVRIPQAGVNILAVDSSPIGLMRAVMFEATKTTDRGGRAQLITVELDFAAFGTTDTNGEFILDEIEPGEYVLIAYASRYYTHYITTFSAVEGVQLPRYDIPLKHCGVIEGRAFLNREPFAKANLTIQGNPGQIEWRTQTDANGNYCVGGIVMPESHTAIEGAFRGRNITEGYGSRYSLMLDARVVPGATTTLNLDFEE
jgi:RNA polymerase sigma-70 factor (ECF subfamily)